MEKRRKFVSIIGSRHWKCKNQQYVNLVHTLNVNFSNFQFFNFQTELLVCEVLSWNTILNGNHTSERSTKEKKLIDGREKRYIWKIEYARKCSSKKKYIHRSKCVEFCREKNHQQMCEKILKYDIKWHFIQFMMLLIVGMFIPI